MPFALPARASAGLRAVPAPARWPLQALAFGAVAVPYAVLALLGATEVAGVLALTTLWLPAAIGPATIARWPRVWPGALAAIVLAEAAIDTYTYASSPRETALWILGNAAAAVVGAYVLVRLGSVVLERPGQLVGLVVAAFAAAATFGVASGLAVGPFLPSFLNAIPGDVVGFVVAAPLILGIGRRTAWSPRFGQTAAVASVLTASVVVFLLPVWPTGRVSPWQVVIVMALLFLTVGTGMAGISVALPTALLIGIWATRFDRGPFVVIGTTDDTPKLQSQAFIAVVTLGLYAVALMWDTYRRGAVNEARSRALLAAVVRDLPARVEIEQLDGTGPAPVAFAVDTVVGDSGTVERVHRFVATDDDERPLADVTVAYDVTSEHWREEQMRMMFDRSPVAMVRLSLDGEIVECNTAFSLLSGRTAGEVLGAPLDRLLGEARADVDDWTVDPAGVEDVPLVRSDGRVRWVSVERQLFPALATRAPFELVCLDDVTERRAHERELRHRATHDALTGLPNRHALEEALAAAVRRRPDDVAILFCDVDGLKRVNDTLGHQAGDALLIEVASRIRSLMPSKALVARFGGDEFVVVVADEPRGVDELASALRGSLRDPLSVDGRDLVLTMSVGIAVADPDVGPGDLVRRADLAMYEAKAQGRDRAVHYRPDMERRARHALAVEAVLRQALPNGDLSAHLQHVVAASDRRVMGVEALARLGGPVAASPADFIAVAESTGLMTCVSEAVVGSALQAASGLLRAGLAMSINASPLEFSRDDYADWLLAILARYDVPPHRLVVEITESVALDASGPVRRAIDQLREHRVRLAIDDFGTGYSSLSALRELPVDIVKLDRSFVSGLPSDGDSLAICRGVISVAHEMGILVVGEGVETEEQADCLAALGCDRLQGYAFHRPAPAAAVAESLLAGMSHVAV